MEIIKQALSKCPYECEAQARSYMLSLQTELCHASVSVQNACSCDCCRLQLPFSMPTNVHSSWYGAWMLHYCSCRNRKV